MLPFPRTLHFIKKTVVIPRLSSLVAFLCITCKFSQCPQEGSFRHGQVEGAPPTSCSTHSSGRTLTPCALRCPVLGSPPAAFFPVLALPLRATGSPPLLPWVLELHMNLQYLYGHVYTLSCTVGTVAPVNQKCSRVQASVISKSSSNPLWFSVTQPQQSSGFPC